MSYTAPILSKTDEEDEVAGLSAEEREAILDDVYGRNAANNDQQHGNGNNNNNEQQVGNNDDDISEDLLFQTDLAFIDIPYSKSKSYFDAGLQAPLHVLETEGDPKRFLRCEDYNPRLAALRICEYWKTRVEIFKERAFEPMTLQGAMRDVVPFMALMPNLIRILPDDIHGRTVFCWDRTNVSFKEYDESVFLKIIWYVAHVGIQRRSTQEKGVVVIQVNHSSLWDFPPRNLQRMLLKSVSDCFPIKIRSTHFCLSSMAVQFVLPMYKRFLPSKARQRLQVHTSMKNSTVLNDLKSFGLNRNCLPKTLGGEYDERPSWITECELILKEQRRRRKKRNSTNRA